MKNNWIDLQERHDRFEDLDEITPFMQKSFAEKNVLALIKDYESIERLLEQNRHFVDTRKLRKQKDTIEILLVCLWYNWEISKVGFEKEEIKNQTNSVMNKENSDYFLNNQAC